MMPRIIFFGTPAFSVITAKALIAAGLAPIAIVTSPDKLAGRGKAPTHPLLKGLALAEHIPCLQPERLRDEALAAQLQNLSPDVFVVASYGKIIPETILQIPPRGTVNVHPSLLPRHRGASPIQTAILQGDAATGVTLMLTDTEMDHGPIIANATFQLPSSHVTYTELHDELALLGGQMLVETLPKWLRGEITPKEQDHSQATFTRLFTKEDGKIDWTKSAAEIDRLVRALETWPQAWTVWNKNGTPLVLKILSGRVSGEKSPVTPGTIIKEKNGELAVCTQDNLYNVMTVQPPGKRPMSGKDFLNGNPLIVGNLVGI